jgi:hypothetical protein
MPFKVFKTHGCVLDFDCGFVHGFLKEAKSRKDEDHDDVDFIDVDAFDSDALVVNGVSGAVELLPSVQKIPDLFYVLPRCS